MHPLNEIAYEVYTNKIEEIITDQGRLGINRRNIITNSIKYSKLSANSYIRCEIEQLNSKNVIRIKENGIGIEESQIYKVFNMFHRGTEISIGSGLGLYIALETAVTLGARIQVSSKVMDNTVFTIEIPNLNITD